jgi:glycosyltransferase involved in cell wall biosynthesis
MNIVEIVNTLEFGGTERMVVNLATSLHGLGHQLSVVCLRSAGVLRAPLERAGVAIVPLNKPEGPNLRVVRDLTSFLKRHNVDVVHTHNPLVHHYGLVAGRLAGVPVIVNTIHGIRNLGPGKGPKEILFSLSCRWSERIVAVCPMAYRTFRAGGVIPQSKLITINNGIPLEAFLGVEPRQPSDNFVFGIVGRLEAVKDHRSLLEAFALVLHEQPQCRLEVLGDGPERANLERRARELGIADKVLWRGFSDDVARFLQGIDVAVMCSTSEALPLSMLEAMAAARPVIGTAVGGMPDLIDNGDCGWLCPPSRPDQLAATMLLAVAVSPARRASMAECGRARATGEYSLVRMTHEYEGLFQQLLAASPRGRVPVTTD